MSNISYNKDIFAHFKKVITADRPFYKDWIVRWDYQDKRRKRKVKYDDGLPKDFYSYAGARDLENWINWIISAEKPNYLKQSEIEDNARRSWGFDKKIFEKAGFKVDERKYISNVGTYNAQDYFFTNLLPSPTESKPVKILDFGAGFGRQINLLHQSGHEIIYVGMDAIPKPYCLQHFYYSETGMLCQEYLLNRSDFNLENAGTGIHHLPTWRWDLLPDNYFDRIYLVQVMQELNPNLVKELIKTMDRVMKPGGALYIRDDSAHFRPVHRLNTRELLSKWGFILEYEHHALHGVELHGIPRIWRKKRPEVEKSKILTANDRLHEMMLDFDAMTRGKVKKAVKGILGS